MRGDKTADYGTVMQVMARIQAAGYTQDRPRHPAGTGRYLKHEDRPHDIGGAACGGARLRAVLAVGAEAVRGRRRRGAAGRYRAGRIDHPDPAGRQEGDRQREAGAEADREARDRARRRRRSARTSVDTDKTADAGRQAESRSRPRRCPKPSPKPEPKPVDAAEARAGRASPSRSRPPCRRPR